MNVDTLNCELLAGMIDYTLLKPDITDNDLKELCITAQTYGFKTIAVNSVAVKKCNRFSEGKIPVDAAVSFPLGQCTIETKAFEAIDAIENGAGEIDYVVNLTEVKNGNWDYVSREMERMVSECKKRNVCIKVIFENCYLNDEEKVKLCEIANRVKPDYIKTSTGFGSGGAAIHDVALMRKTAEKSIKIKAAGGIRTTEDALKLIQAGADRIGTSAGCSIVDGFRNRKEKEEYHA